MVTKDEFIAEKSLEYDKMVWCNKQAAKLEKKIAAIRAKGYSLIVLGQYVRITLKKNR